MDAKLASCGHVGRVEFQFSIGCAGLFCLKLSKVLSMFIIVIGLLCRYSCVYTCTYISPLCPLTITTLPTGLSSRPNRYTLYIVIALWCHRIVSVGYVSISNHAQRIAYVWVHSNNVPCQPCLLPTRSPVNGFRNCSIVLVDTSPVIVTILWAPFAMSYYFICIRPR